MVKTIRMIPDYSCDPLWDEETADYVEPEELGLSLPLADRLQRWQRIYDGILNLQNPSLSCFSSFQEEQDFEAEGKTIAQQIQSELGSDYEVYYRNQPVREAAVV